MSDKTIMHTACLLCGKHAASVPYDLEGLPYTNYSYCKDCIRKGIKLLKHKSMQAQWWEHNPNNSDNARLIGCSHCGRTWIVANNVPYEEFISEKHYCENCGSYMMEGKRYGPVLSVLLLVRYRKWRLLYETRKRAFRKLRQEDKPMQGLRSESD